VVEVATAARPGRIELDPARQTMDWNYLNNAEGVRFPFVGMVSLGRAEHRLGWSETTPARRDRRVVNWLPLAWFNDVGGLTLGFQSRANYLGRFELNATQFTWPTGLWRPRLVASAGGPLQIENFRMRLRPDWYVSIRNPVRGRAPRRQMELAGWWLEGRVGGRAAVEFDRSPRFGGPVRSSAGASLSVMAVTDAAYLDRRRWDDKNTAEFSLWAERSLTLAESASRSRLELAAGQAFWPQMPEVNWVWPGPVMPPGPRELRGARYARAQLSSQHEMRVGSAALRLRGVVAGTLGGTAVPLQRRIFLGGADPYATFANPVLRSRGALLARDDVHYGAAGGLGLRGFSPVASGTWGVALNTEAGLRLLDRPRRRVFGTVMLAAFADAALLDRAALGRAAAADAGIGVRVAHQIGPTRFVTRLDIPLLVTRPSAAVAGAAGDGAFKFRWVWSFEEAF